MTMTGNKFKFNPRFLAELSRKSKLAIVGSAGVGKTTLLNELFELDLITGDFTKIPEMVRVVCAERGYESPYDIPAEEVNEFREHVLDRQIELENQTEKFIADRSCLDAWLYFMRWSWNNVDVEVSERFFQKAYAQTKKYQMMTFTLWNILMV